MALVNPPVWLAGGNYRAADDRLVTGLLVDHDYTDDGALTRLGSGVVGPAKRVQATANGTMNVTVSAGLVVVPRESLNPPGAYLCFNNANATVAVPTISTSQRNDILCARVNDADEGNPGDNWEFTLVTGTASASPADPTVPANYVKIARINVKSAALNGGANKITAAQVTDLRTFATGLGGVHIVWNGVYPRVQPGRLVYDTSANNDDVLKLGVTGGEWHTLVPDETHKTRSQTYGWRSDYYDDTVIKSGAGTTWDPTPQLDSNHSQSISAINVDAASYYGSSFKVTVAALGKCDDSVIGGHLSVQVRDGNTVIYDPAIGRGPSFYATHWVSSENSFLVNLPSNYTKKSLNFRVMFKSSYFGSGTAVDDLAKFQRIRLIVEPQK